MTDKLYAQKRYEQWLAERREVRAPENLADRIMSQVAELDCQRPNTWWLCLVERIEDSRAARWSVCGGALAVGVLPFLVFSYVPSF
ncbi:MAG: hypothetical protein HKN47_12695 [Pirellulaceae bacterium]|nr:hypothetical protein [Pirellulaceae bacterium]